MKYKQIIFFVGTILTGEITFAQTSQNAALDDFKAASSNQLYQFAQLLFK